MRELWTRVERWVDAQPEMPSSAEVFGPPATAAAIAASEQALGQEFSPTFRESLLIHDGQRDDTAWLWDQMRLLPLRLIEDEWNAERESEREFVPNEFGESTGPADSIRDFPTVTHAGRLPIACQEGASYLYLDFVPGPAGVPGQVIRTRDECSFLLAGRDFAECLSDYVDLLERGVLRYDADEYAAVVPVDQLRDGPGRP